MNKDKINFFLDITSETCPMTFVRTKLVIEQMKQGDLAEILLTGTEPLENIPRSLEEMGNIIVSLEPEINPEKPDAMYRLKIRKT